MAIGRPIELTPNIATKNISSLATADQTQFTVTGGYRINEIAVYRNGVRLAEGRDFTASDGDTVNLVTAATVDDVIEFAVFDSFNVSDAIVSAASSQNLNGDFNVTGILYAGTFEPGQFVSGIVTSNTALHVGSALTANAAGDVETIGIITAATFKGDGSGLTGIGETVNVRTETITVSGVSTFTGVSNFSAAINADATTDSTSTTTGALIVDGGVGIAKNVYIGAGLSVAGTLTYEDVTNVDSVGLITAKSGVNVTGGELTVGSGITMGIAGVATFSGTGDVHLTDNVKLNAGDGLDLQVYHDGSNSYVKHSGAGNLRIEAAGGADEDIILKAKDAIFLQPADGEDGINIAANGAVSLYYDDSLKFATTNDGTVTTGIATATAGLRINADGSASANHLALGASLDDLLLWHQNGNSYFVNNDGNLTIRSDGHVYIQDASGNTLADFNEDGPVELYHNANKKFETTNDGTVTTGVSTATGLSALGSALFGIEARSVSTQATDSNKALKVKNNSDDNTFSVSYRGEVFVGPYDGGFLGIGTDNPLTQLHITSAGPVITHDATNGSSGLRINSQQYQTAGQLLRIQNAGITTFVVEDNGYVGVNTSTVQRGPLHVHQNSTGDCQIHLTNDETGPTSTDGFTIFTGGNAGPNAGFVNRETGGDIQVYTHNGSSVGLRLTIEDEGNLVSLHEIHDSKGDVRQIIYQNKTGAYVLVASDAGKAIHISTGGVTINNSLFSAGDAVTIINNSGSTQTITQGSGVTLYDTNDESTGNKTLKARGMATVWFSSASIGYISGNFS